jgi:hypothetical protein
MTSSMTRAPGAAPARSLAIVTLALASIAACGQRPAFIRQAEKLAVVSDIQRELLESVDAEKSAVLATTDEESAAFASQSRHSSEEIGRLKGRLEQLIAEDGRPDERAALAAFTAKWAALQDVDARLLDLAVANSNLKAARLLMHDGSTQLDRFVSSVDAVTAASSDVAVVRSLSHAATAVARIQSLLFEHIPETSDVEMTALETRIRELGEGVDASLRDADAADAAAAWTEYQRIAAEVIRLSRLNTNVISFDVSIHEKRFATAACLDALGELQAAIQSGPNPTR